MNVHLLSHLSLFAHLYGPLWTHLAFPFEDAIGHTVERSHGKRDIVKQVYVTVNDKKDHSVQNVHSSYKQL